MPEERFDIFFAGRLIPGQDPAVAREKVARLFKASEAQLGRLFSGRPVAVKKGVDLDTAARYRLAFRDAGALVDIRAAAESPPAPRADTGWTLAQPNSGSLEEYAPRVAPAPLPDISGLAISPPDRPLDETPPPPPAHIDTGELDLVANGDWTLEDCAPRRPPAPLPDISGMSLVEPPERSVNPSDTRDAKDRP